MPGGSDVRAGGVYVEAYVKNEALDRGLTATNQKIRSSISVAKSAMGSVVSGTGAIGGAALLGTFALAGRGLMGFYRGARGPAKQATTDTQDIVAAIRGLHPVLNQLKSPLGSFLDLFQVKGLKGALQLMNLRKLLRDTLPPETYSRLANAFDAFFGGAKKSTEEVKKLAQAVDQVKPDRVAKRKSTANPNGRTWIEELKDDQGNVVRKGHWRRNPQPKSSVVETTATSSSMTQTALAIDKVTQSTERSKSAIDRMGWALIDLSKRGPKSVQALTGLTVPVAVGGIKLTADAFKAAPGAASAVINSFIPSTTAGQFARRGRFISALFGDSLSAGLYRAVGQGTRSARIAIAADTSWANAFGIWVRKPLRAAGMAALGAAAGGAVGGPFGAAFGAALAVKPVQTARVTAGIVTRILRGSVYAIGSALSFRRPQTELEKLDSTAKKTTTSLGQLKNAAASVSSGAGMLSRMGSALSGGWFKMSAIAGGVLATVGKFSADSAVNARAAANAMGISVGEASKLGAAAELAGSSLDAVRGAATHINDAISSGGGELGKYLDLEALKAASPEKRLSMVANALQNIKDPAARAKAAMDMLGTTDLMPLMMDFEGLQGRAKSLGAVLDEAQAESAMQLKQAFAELAIAGRSVGSAFSATIAPAISGVARAITTWTTNNRPLLQTLFAVVRNVVVAASVVQGLAFVGAKVAFVWPIVATVLGMVMSPLGLVTAGIVALIAFFPSLRSQAVSAFTSMYEGVMSFAGPAIEGFQTVKAEFMDVFQGIIDALSAGDLALAGQIAIDGLRYGFAAGWALIHSEFLAARNGFMDVFNAMIADIRVAGEDLFPGFDQAWTETMGFFYDAWTVAWNGILGSFDVGYKYLMKAINYLKSIWDSTFDMEGANKAVQAEIDKKSAARGASQDQILLKRERERSSHYDNVQKKGLRAALDDENADAMAERNKAAAEARKSDQDSLAAAKEKLKASLAEAASKRKTQEAAKTEATSAGAAGAKSGSTEAVRKGFEANDIRTKEGLSTVASTARGPMDRSLELQNKSLAEQKKQTDLQFKTWKQLENGGIGLAFKLK